MMPLPAMSLIVLFEMVKLELVTSVFAPVFPPKSDCTPMPLDPDGFAPWSMLSMTLLWTSPLKVPLPPKNTETPKPSALVIGSASVPLSRMRTLAEAVRPTAVTAIMLLPTLSMSLPLMTNGFGACAKGRGRIDGVGVRDQPDAVAADEDVDRRGRVEESEIRNGIVADRAGRDAPRGSLREHVNGILNAAVGRAARYACCSRCSGC